MIPIRDDAPRFCTPYVNYFLMVANTVVFLYGQIILTGGEWETLNYRLGFVPLKLTALLAGYHHINVHGVILPVSMDTAFLPVLTSMFLHAGWFHLIFNMWALWIFGDNVEDYLGHFRYLLFYFLSGTGAAALHYVLNSNSALPTVGASGAIAGIMGAYLILFPSARVLTLVPLLFFITFINLPAWLVLGFWFIAQFLSGTASAIASPASSRGGVAVWAHVGGFLCGIGMIKLFPKRPRRLRVGAWYG